MVKLSWGLSKATATLASRGGCNSLRPTIAMVGVLVLTACATAPTEPKVRIVEKQVPVRQACVPADTPPPPTYSDVTVSPDVVKRFQNRAAANEERRARLAIVEPIIASCR